MSEYGECPCVTNPELLTRNEDRMANGSHQLRGLSVLEPPSYDPFRPSSENQP
ncbi:hypothetical protein SNOG_16518 [Parastagonospora nodorum SN15]|uniref:Uncharacterized protein n=1 Tax=Phaeosphaeria nodorum (strain SN15 / ATCC MYA-4574 / FGSC 10173) TaxID=321614 RepID=Q0TVE6_PHANO|nr:hypothetical protein SNOG_16518 [Parastagonospora nodorum SN15]EAT76123.1 hypothetical protein SNOG_16518 [Parastagonospora nodorum SN15]